MVPPLKIVLCGPPRSGKSCLRQALKEAIRRASTVYPYVLNANPDGEGSWFQETSSVNPELAAALKKENKRTWSPERATLYASWVRSVEGPLTFVDSGGIPDEITEEIARPASHLLLLAPTVEQFDPWRDFSRRIGVPVFAEILSHYHATDDDAGALDEDSIYRGIVHHLERGEVAHERPLVKALAGHILNRLEFGVGPSRGRGSDGS